MKPKPKFLDEDLLELSPRARGRAIQRRLGLLLLEAADADDPSSKTQIAAAQVLMEVEEAASAAGRSPQTIRNWSRTHRIGFYDRRSRRFLVDRDKLKFYMLARFGRLPAGLRD
jgi:hypothetical protein